MGDTMRLHRTHLYSTAVRAHQRRGRNVTSFSVPSFRETQAKSHHCAALRDAVCAPEVYPTDPSLWRLERPKAQKYKETKGTLWNRSFQL